MPKLIPASKRERRLTAGPLALATLLSIAGAAAPAPAAAQSLARRVDRLLDAPPFDHSLWGVALVDEHGKLIYQRNATRMFITASNTKLVVTTVAAALLSPDFTVQTSV